MERNRNSGATPYKAKIGEDIMAVRSKRLYKTLSML